MVIFWILWLVALMCFLASKVLQHLREKEDLRIRKEEYIPPVRFYQCGRHVPNHPKHQWYRQEEK
jgi:hypothetical protein